MIDLLRVIICSLMFLILLQNATMALTCRPTAPDELGFSTDLMRLRGPLSHKDMFWPVQSGHSADCSPIFPCKGGVLDGRGLMGIRRRISGNAFFKQNRSISVRKPSAAPLLRQAPHIHIRVSVPGFLRSRHSALSRA